MLRSSYKSNEQLIYKSQSALNATGKKNNLKNRESKGHEQVPESLMHKVHNINGSRHDLNLAAAKLETLLLFLITSIHAVRFHCLGKE